MTNFEKIKQMSVDELVNFITRLTNGCEYGCMYCANYVYGVCTKDGYMHDYVCGCKQWLESEADNE